ncbi:type II toxin-antitoxin system HicB family antitoxin [Treponema bryantii]|uniref:type II toxin-antitoxin system HicB family antitoxin n=1 Tax=Treponema bryantii TaxID=163 RepID=UPI0003B52924|nr:type II toxin-antitoxin system HicB family antitoxin [Treponema bryantii]
MKNEYAFIALFEYAEDGINISFPDLPGCLSCAEVDNTEEALKNAKEALGLYLFGMEQDSETIPEATSLNKIQIKKNCVPVVIDVFMPSVRAAVKTSFVKKTLSLPAWLAALADEKNVNCSKIFQDALKNFLGVEEPRTFSAVGIA